MKYTKPTKALSCISCISWLGMDVVLLQMAKTMLALAAEREQQFELARSLFADLNREFPTQSVFAHELLLLNTR
jgi:hypothetical protein